MNITSLTNRVKTNRYYYTHLTPSQKPIYETILAGLQSYSTRIKVPAMPINEMSQIFTYVLLDNPLLFHTVNPPFNYISAHGRKNEVQPNYKFTKQITRRYIDEIDLYMRGFDALKSKSDIEKVQGVHDYCLDRFKYDYGFGEHAHTILGLVLNQSAVCEGISKFVKLALDYLSVKSLIVTGKAKNPNSGKQENHAWNIVKVDGKTYHLDVTFDMTLTKKLKRYDYFNLSDKEIMKDHIITGDVPVCKFQDADYFTANSLVVHNPKELKLLLQNKLKQGTHGIIFKAMVKGKPEELQSKIIHVATQMYTDLYRRNVTLGCSANLSQMVFEINFK